MILRTSSFRKSSALLALMAVLTFISCPHDGIAAGEILCALADRSDAGHAHDSAHQCDFDEAHSHEIPVQHQRLILPDISSSVTIRMAGLNSAPNLEVLRSTPARYFTSTETLLTSVILRL